MPAVEGALQIKDAKDSANPQTVFFNLMIFNALQIVENVWVKCAKEGKTLHPGSYPAQIVLTLWISRALRLSAVQGTSV